jgi:hypothetical protein
MFASWCKELVYNNSQNHLFVHVDDDFDWFLQTAAQHGDH